jgi:5-methylcytosine-specific restriction endonuclease McrA
VTGVVTELTPKQKKAAYDLARRLADPDRYKAVRLRYRLADPARKKAQGRRYYLANKERINVKNRAWQRDHAEEFAAYQRAWRIANLEKVKATQAARNEKVPEERRLIQARRRAARRTGGDLTDAEWQEILEAFDSRCAYCDSPDRLELEHVVPLSRGGRHTKSNVVPACRPCNRSKGNKTLAEFLGHLTHS